MASSPAASPESPDCGGKLRSAAGAHRSGKAVPLEVTRGAEVQYQTRLRGPTAQLQVGKAPLFRNFEIPQNGRSSALVATVSRVIFQEGNRRPNQPSGAWGGISASKAWLDRRRHLEP